MMLHRWEHSPIGWTQVVYHGRDPVMSKVDATPAEEVPADCIDACGEPIFGKLRERFPKPEARLG